MRKFQHVALVVAAAGGLSAIGAGPSVADAPVAYGNTAPPPGPAAVSWTATQATAHTSGSPAPQRQAAQPTEVAPQVNPQVNPQLSPHISPQSAPAPSGAGATDQFNLFRPAQECSPQSLLNANLPVAVLAAAETKGIRCTQANSQANALAKAN
jgi:hypothetical protein